MSKRFVAFVKGVVCVAMVGVSLGALALPSPKDIEAAVDAGHLAQAESMLREVIQEKPQSAKAHYELGEVLAREGHYAQAAQELKEAKSLEPSLKFTHQPEQFNALFEVEESNDGIDSDEAEFDESKLESLENNE